MTGTDPIADFLTRIRNAQRARHDIVKMPGSKMKVRLAEILREEGYVKDVSVRPSGEIQPTIEITLRYEADGTPLIRELRRVSRQSRRIFSSAEELRAKAEGLATEIVSTSSGILTDREASEKNVGGEIICSIT